VPVFVTPSATPISTEQLESKNVEVVGALQTSTNQPPRAASSSRKNYNSNAAALESPLRWVSVSVCVVCHVWCLLFFCY
jgi:hypothetical protein